MPYRGRDTYYLERFMASVCIAMGIMVIATDYNAHTVYVRLVGDFLMPTWFLAGSWLVAGGLLAYGTIKNDRGYLEWGSLFTFTLWTFFTYKSFLNYELFPTSTFLAPVHAGYAAVVYFYHRKVALYERRSAEIKARVSEGHSAELGG